MSINSLSTGYPRRGRQARQKRKRVPSWQCRAGAEQLHSPVQNQRGRCRISGGRRRRSPAVQDLRGRAAKARWQHHPRGHPHHLATWQPPGLPSLYSSWPSSTTVFCCSRSSVRRSSSHLTSSQSSSAFSLSVITFKSSAVTSFSR